MALFKALVKSTGATNGVRLEKGISVDFSSLYGSRLGTNAGHEVINAFLRKNGVDIKKACAVSSAYIDVIKVS